MVDIFSNLILGFGVALTPVNLFYCLIGALFGTLVGVLPGIGPLATIAMLLPITFSLPPVTALIMLAGIYYGAQYGGSTTSILVNIPGEATSIVTCLDGYAMARQGRAGPALGIAAIGSFFAGCVSTLIICLFAPPLAEVALKFGSVEYFSLMLFGLIGAVVLAHGSVIKAVAMILLGLLFGLVGTDVNTGVLRFSFGFSDLSDGIGLGPIAIGLFGFAEIVSSLEQKKTTTLMTSTVQGLLPTRADLKASWKAVLRGTALGSLLGILPGGGPLLSSFASYTLEKRLADDPSRFGKGAIEGVAGPESANNAGAQTSFIPMLTLGIPTTGVMAMMLGALMIHGIAPGPQVMIQRPELFWGLIASMWFGNLMLLMLNLPLIGIWIRLLTVPYRLLYPSILAFCCIGVYSLNNSPFEVILAAGFGLFGYVFSKLDCETAPLLLGFILGPMMEENLRRAMLLSRGDPTVFFTRPISLAMLMGAAFLLLLIVAPPFGVNGRRSSRNNSLKFFGNLYFHPRRCPMKFVFTIAVLVMSIALIAISAGDGFAQSYPSKPIHFIVPWTAGGPTDLVARIVGQKLTESWGQPVVVENRPGAGGQIGLEIVAKATPDGYTLGENNNGDSISVSLYKKLPYDIIKDFSPVTQMVWAPFILVVHPSVPAKSVKELIELAKSNPGKLNFGSAGIGVASHLTGELFKKMAGVDIVHIPYKGQSQATTDLLGGQVSMMFNNPVTALPLIKSGKLRALAVTSAKRSPVVPDLPAIAESGLPGYDVITWYGVLAPAGTPKEIVTKLNTEIVRILYMPDLQERLAAVSQHPIGNTPEEFAAVIKSEIAKWAKVIKDSGISID